MELRFFRSPSPPLMGRSINQLLRKKKLGDNFKAKLLDPPTRGFCHIAFGEGSALM